MSQRPAIFIDSSSEGLKIAKSVQAELSPVAAVTVWSQGVFQPAWARCAPAGRRQSVSPRPSPLDRASG